MTISPQIRIVALVGLVAALGLGASMLMLGRGSKTETAAAPSRATHTAPAAHTTPVATRHTTAPAHHTAKARTAAPAHRAPAAKHTAKHAPAGYRGFPVYAQLPRPLQWQLAHHRVVVVSIYNPRSDVDAISVAEAHAGAVDAKAGFLLVSVLDNTVAGILTALLPGGGLLPDPGVLVYRAPGVVAVRLDGFADRASVAQAATNAFAGETAPEPTATVAAAPVAAPAATPATTTTP